VRGRGIAQPLENGGIVDAVAVRDTGAVLDHAGGGVRLLHDKVVGAVVGGAGRARRIEEDVVVVEPGKGIGAGVLLEDEALPPVLGAVVGMIGGDSRIEVGTARVRRPDEKRLAPVAWAFGVAVERGAAVVGGGAVAVTAPVDLVGDGGGSADDI